MYLGHSPTNAGSFIFLDDIASGFNGSETQFTLQVGGVSITPNTQNLLIALDGIIQQAPDAYTTSGSTITFTGAVPSGTDFYGILMGQSASIGQGTIGADELKISGNGTSGQLVKSDGDGTYSYLSTTDITSVGTLSSLTLGGDLLVPQYIKHVGDTDCHIEFGTDEVKLRTGDSSRLIARNSNVELYSPLVATSATFSGAVTATGSDYMLKAVSTSTTNSDAIRISAESGLAQGKIEIGWHNDSSQAGGGYGSIQVGKSANTPEIRIGASKITAINGGIQANNNDIIAKMTTAGSGIRVVADRVDQNDFGGFEIRNNGSQRWFVGMRELGNDDLQFFNGNSSSGVYQNVLSLNHSNANATFAGNVQLPNGYQLQWGGTNNAIFGHHTNNYVKIKTNGVDRFTIDSSGDINIASQAMVLGTNASSTNRLLRIARFASNSTDLEIGELRYTGSSDGGHAFAGIKTYVHHTNGRGRLEFWVNDASTYDHRMKLYYDGNLSIDGSLSSSDLTFKKNVKTITSALDTVNSLRGVTYNWKVSTGKDTKTKQYGMIAQEVEELLPELVKDYGDKSKKQLNYTAIIPVLVESIKELTAKVNALEGS